MTRRPAAARDAPPLLFVHGAWHGAWCWDAHFLPWFAGEGFEAHAVDLRGHGASDNDRGLRSTRIDHYVDDVAGAVALLDRPPVLIGHSMGGLVVQRYLEGRRLAGAVLMAPVPVGGAVGVTLRTLRRHPLVFAKVNLQLRLWPIVGSPDLAQEHLFSKDADPEDVAEYIARLQDESYLAFLDMLLFRRPRPDRVDTPVLVMAAERDGLFTLDEMIQTGEAYGGAPLVISGAGHDLMLDSRWQQAAESIRDWVLASAT